MKDVMEIQQSRIQESALDCRFTGWKHSLSETHAALLQDFMKTLFFLTLSLILLKSMKQGFSTYKSWFEFDYVHTLYYTSPL